MHEDDGASGYWGQIRGGETAAAFAASSDATWREDCVDSWTLEMKKRKKKRRKTCGRHHHCRRRRRCDDANDDGRCFRPAFFRGKPASKKTARKRDERRERKQKQRRRWKN